MQAELTPRETRILAMRGDGIARDEIGREFGVTGERIRQLEARARLKIERTETMTLQTSVPRKLTLEELIPEDPPLPVLSKTAGKTARVRLTRDVWPNTKLTKGERLYAGQVVTLPEKEARSLVENRCATLTFDEPGDNEELK